VSVLLLPNGPLNRGQLGLSDILPHPSYRECEYHVLDFPYNTTSIISSRTTRDVVLPFSQTVVGIDRSKLDAIALPAGSTLLVSLLNANRDPSIWGSDSHEWNPERWLSPLPSSVKEAHIPGVYSNV
jgi:hypothetical protein